MNNRKTLLLITTAFYPENAIGAVRTTKLIKNLVNLGWSITVISPKLGDNCLIDDTLYSKEIDFMEKHVVDYGKLFKTTLRKKRDDLISKKSSGAYLGNNSSNVLEVLKRAIYKGGYFVYLMAKNKNWKKQVLKFYDKEFKHRKFDVLLTTYPSLSSHSIGLALKKRGIYKKWIADFQDPIPYKTLNTKIQYIINNIYQRHIIRKADAVTAVTQNLLMSLVNCSVQEKPFEYIPMSYDKNDDLDEYLPVNEKISDKKFNISYLGSLYGGKRDTSVIFDAINTLILNGVIQMDGISFNYAGNDTKVVEEVSKKYNCSKILNVLGSLTRKEAIRVQQLSDINVIITWNTQHDKGVIPGKLYEAFLVKKPILSLVLGDEENSELSYMVKKSKLGMSYELVGGRENYEDIKQKIAEYIKGVFLGYEKKLMDKAYIEDFKDEVVSKKMSDFMIRIIREK